MQRDALEVYDGLLLLLLPTLYLILGAAQVYMHVHLLVRIFLHAVVQSCNLRTIHLPCASYAVRKFSKLASYKCKQYMSVIMQTGSLGKAAR